MRSRIPAGARRVLLILQPKPASSPDGRRYDLHALDDRPEALPAGHFAFVNLTGSDYAVQWGNLPPVTLAQGPSRAYAIPTASTVRFATQQNDRWLPAGLHTLSLGTHQRARIFLFPPVDAGGVYPLIRQLTDNVSPAEKSSDQSSRAHP